MICMYLYIYIIATDQDCKEFFLYVFCLADFVFNIL